MDRPRGESRELSSGRQRGAARARRYASCRHPSGAALLVVLAAACLAVSGGTVTTGSAPLAAAAGTSVLGSGMGLGRLDLWNLDPADAASVRARFHAAAGDDRLDDGPWELAVGTGLRLGVDDLALPDGAYALRLAADHSVGASVTAAWPSVGAVATYPAVAPATDLIVPLVHRGSDDLWTSVLVRAAPAPDASSPTTTVRVTMTDAAGSALVDTTAVVAREAVVTLDLAKDAAFGPVPVGAIGWMRLIAERPIVAVALTTSTHGARAAIVPAVPATTAASRLVVPLRAIRRQAAADGQPAVETWVYLTNIGPDTLAPRVTFRGSGGTCEGTRFDWSPAAVRLAPRAMLVGTPSGSDADDCRQTIEIDAGRSAIFGSVVLTDPDHRALATYGAIAASPATDAYAERRFLPGVLSSGAFAAFVPMRATSREAASDGVASSLVAPTVRKDAEGPTTFLQVMNVGPAPSTMELAFVDGRGAPVAGCGDACRATVQAMSAREWWLGDLAVLPDGFVGSAIVSSSGPAVAVQLDASPTGDYDASVLPSVAIDGPTAATERWLPYFPSRACAAAPVDLVIVLDASTSMTGPRMDAMRMALLPLVTALDFAGGDQVGLVTFNSLARTMTPLGSDSAAVAAALVSIQPGPESRLDLGIAAGQSELASARHRAANRAVLLALTDGRVAPVPASEAIAAALAAKSAGTRMIAVGLGPDVDTEALRTIASASGDYHAVDDERRLSDALRRVGDAVRCP